MGSSSVSFLDGAINLTLHDTSALGLVNAATQTTADTGEKYVEDYPAVEVKR